MNRSHIYRRPGSCMRCRHRKIRCDGGLPVCGPCKILPGGAEDCEYRDEVGGKTRTEVLEENIARLEQRLHELQNADDPRDSPVVLSPPHSREPSTEEIHASLSTFMTHSACLGFFLHPGKFRDTALRSQESVSASLLNAIYLWGARLAPQPRPHLETFFLARTQQCLAADLNRSDSGRVLHVIQAELLLSLYYVDIGRNTKGCYHANAAVALSLSAKLFTFRPTSSVSPIEQLERIYAFWACLTISNDFAIPGSPFHLPSQTLSGVTTPWPNPDASGQCQGGTVNNYVHGRCDGDNSSKTLVAKASILFEWASTVFDGNGSPTRDQTSFLACCSALEARISALLPQFPRSHAEIARSPELTLAYTLVQLAIIKRCLPVSNSEDRMRDRCFHAAFEVASVLREALSQGVPGFNPMLWVKFGLCASVLATHRSLAEQQGVVAGRSAQDSEQARQVIVSLLKRFSDRRPLASYVA